MTGIEYDVLKGVAGRLFAREALVPMKVSDWRILGEKLVPETGGLFGLG